jgi:hypothetical protein
MYAERKKLREFHTNRKYEDYAEQAYMEHEESFLFLNRFTFGDKLRVAAAPFSCGNKYRMPIWQIENWILGVENEDV